MPLLCFEGPSAAGKTAASSALCARCGGFVIPEVNKLFPERDNSSPTWYFDRQVDRWAIAQDQLQDGRVVIFDGDPFQPLWYNWSYNFIGWQGPDILSEFYRPRIINRQIGFPDRYVLFSADIAELTKRKQSDPLRTRRSFETHLRFIEPQRRYFDAMNAAAPGILRVVDTTNLDTARTGAKIHELAREIEDKADWTYSVELFDYLINWIKTNPAEP